MGMYTPGKAQSCSRPLHGPKQTSYLGLGVGKTTSFHRLPLLYTNGGNGGNHKSWNSREPPKEATYRQYFEETEVEISVNLPSKIHIFPGSTGACQLGSTAPNVFSHLTGQPSAGHFQKPTL